MARGQKSAANFIAGMNATAEKLAAVRAELGRREESFKEQTDALYAEEASLKTELLGALKTVGLKSVKVTNGESYSISRVPTFHFVNPLVEDKWAREHHCVRVDRLMLKQVLRKEYERGQLNTTEVEVGERETISIIKPRTAKKADEEGADEDL